LVVRRGVTRCAQTADELESEFEVASSVCRDELTHFFAAHNERLRASARSAAVAHAALAQNASNVWLSLLANLDSTSK
jgi:hypothetical protein